jgi:hypothetical protein
MIIYCAPSEIDNVSAASGENCHPCRCTCHPRWDGTHYNTWIPTVAATNDTTCNNTLCAYGCNNGGTGIAHCWTDHDYVQPYKIMGYVIAGCAGLGLFTSMLVGCALLAQPVDPNKPFA